jgi:hypothetical protein
MSHLRPEKLHVKFTADATPEGPVIPRRYTLTHSDRTGEMFLSIGPAYNEPQISGWYTRFLRDEVLAEWTDEGEGPALHVHCHVSGGLVMGTARWRDGIFRHHLPMVLEALRVGDDVLYEYQPELDHAPIWVHFHATQRRYNRVEAWGIPADYR